MQNRKDINVVIVDYGMGNLRSIQKNIERLGYIAKITSNPSELVKAKKILLPGVGHYANGMKKLLELNLIGVLNNLVINKKVPILGICLGMQLFSKKSEEGNVEGLGWLNAETVKFNIIDKKKYKIPHMGWNSIKIVHSNPLFNGISEEELFYFVHSYHWKSNDDADILTTTNYEYEFVSSVRRQNIFGTQFHPEKSHKKGMLVLQNFLELI